MNIIYNMEFIIVNVIYKGILKLVLLFQTLQLIAQRPIASITTKKSSCPSVFFPAFLQTAVIDKPIPALFVGALQSAAIGGL